jgi:hypothetical protein
MEYSEENLCNLVIKFREKNIKNIKSLFREKLNLIVSRCMRKSLRRLDSSFAFLTDFKPRSSSFMVDCLSVKVKGEYELITGHIIKGGEFYRTLEFEPNIEVFRWGDLPNQLKTENKLGKIIDYDDLTIEYKRETEFTAPKDPELFRLYGKELEEAGIKYDLSLRTLEGICFIIKEVNYKIYIISKTQIEGKEIYAVVFIHS